MRKFLLLGILAACFSAPLKSQAQPLDVPTGGGQIKPPVSATANGFFTGQSTFTVTLTTPTPGYQYCITHLVVTSGGAGQFDMAWSTASMFVSGIGPITGTTDYIVTVASGVPYDTQWAYRTPYCSPQNNLLTLFMGNLPTVSTMTYEGYTFGGLNH